MAKKKQKKAADRAERSEAPSSSAAAPAALTTGNKVLDTAFRTGNYAAVRHLVQGDASADAKKLLDLVKVDMGQAIVGFIAALVVLTVALFTLH